MSTFSLWYDRPPFSVLQSFKASNCESRHPPSVPASLLPLWRRLEQSRNYYEDRSVKLCVLTWHWHWAWLQLVDQAT
ncbi:hypothetical protein LXL04_039267 [Taraxacum kok-saghyz]